MCVMLKPASAQAQHTHAQPGPLLLSALLKHAPIRVVDVISREKEDKGVESGKPHGNRHVPASGMPPRVGVGRGAWGVGRGARGVGCAVWRACSGNVATLNERPLLVAPPHTPLQDPQMQSV